MACAHIKILKNSKKITFTMLTKQKVVKKLKNVKKLLKRILILLKINQEGIGKNQKKSEKERRRKYF